MNQEQCIDMDDLKLRDWKAINKIEELLKKYRSGELTDYETLIKIGFVLFNFGIIDELGAHYD